MKRRWMIIVVMSLGLMACSSHQSETSGPTIDVYPIYATLALQTDAKQLTQAQAEFDEFIHAQHHLLVTQQVMMYWSTSYGERFANKAQQQLRALGVAAENLQLEKMPAGFGQHFDFQIEILTHRVVVPICPYVQLNRFGQEGSGCFSESVRWQSMVNPHKMLQPEMTFTDKTQPEE